MRYAKHDALKDIYLHGKFLTVSTNLHSLWLNYFWQQQYAYHGIARA
ncbi:MAG: hypothetical protein WBA07_13200 [Rivularia sp. (in: cyanobacteria)]